MPFLPGATIHVDPVGAAGEQLHQAEILPPKSIGQRFLQSLDCHIALEMR
jgi:hypothetical protein